MISMKQSNEIRLVIADVDRTLVNDERILTPRTKDVIEKLWKNGVMFGIASGRDYHQLLDDNPYWGFERPFDVTVGMNGGQVYIAEEGKMHAYNQLSCETVKEIIELMEPLDLNPLVYGPDKTMICKRMDHLTKASGERNDMTVHVVEDLSEFWQSPKPKIMYRIDAEQMEEVQAYADAHPSDKYRAFKTQPIMIEFQDPNINKGTGLERVCELLNISTDEVLAFGDMDNDIEMLKTAGHGVCLLNGSDETKASADAVTDYTNNEDGLARYIEDYFPELIGE